MERCQAMVMEQAPWCFSANNLESLAKALAELELKITAARKECWKQGYNVDDVDNILGQCLPHSSSTLPDFRKEKQGEELDPYHVSSRPWSSKQDRINLWLLQNLRSWTTSEVDLHQRALAKYTKKGETLSDEAWARKVLKYWFLDEAATERRETASTNGAVDSEGLPHDVRVELESWNDSDGSIWTC